MAAWQHGKNPPPLSLLTKHETSSNKNKGKSIHPSLSTLFLLCCRRDNGETGDIGLVGVWAGKLQLHCMHMLHLPFASHVCVMYHVSVLCALLLLLIFPTLP